MSLFQRLKNVRSEEDVKDIYIKALGLKSYTKGLIDIRIDEKASRSLQNNIPKPELGNQHN